MTAPRPPGSRTTRLLPLDVTLAIAAAVALGMGLAQRFAPAAAARALDEDPGVRAAGVGFAVLAWMLLVSARLTATGARRLVGRLAGIAFALAAGVRLVGVTALLETNVLLPAQDSNGSRALVGGACLAAASAFVYLTSPARRR